MLHTRTHPFSLRGVTGTNFERSWREDRQCKCCISFDTFQDPKLPALDVQMRIVLDLKAEKGWLWLCVCEDAPVTLGESCDTLMYHFVPPAWLWNLFPIHSDRDSLSGVHTVNPAAHLSGGHFSRAPRCKHHTCALRTRLILKMQPQRWHLAPKNPKDFRFVSKMIFCWGTRGQVPALMSSCSSRCEEFVLK